MNALQATGFAVKTAITSPYIRDFHQAWLDMGDAEAAICALPTSGKQRVRDWAKRAMAAAAKIGDEDLAAEFEMVAEYAQHAWAMDTGALVASGDPAEVDTGGDRSFIAYDPARDDD